MKIKFLIVLIFNFFCFSFNISKANIENKIVVKIDNEIITNYDIKNKIISSIILADQEINQENINNIKKQVLDVLIQLKLKQIALSKYDIETDYQKINNYLKSLSQNINDLKIKFSKNGLDFQMFLDEVETEINWREFIYQKYSSKINIDENSIKDELNKTIIDSSLVKEFNLSEIEIIINNDEFDKEKILDTENSIKNNGFEDTALKYSISTTSFKKGNLGWINSKSLSNQIFKVVSDMQIAEVSKPIKQQNSVLFLKLNNVRNINVKNNQLNLAKIKQNIINQKKNNLFDLYSKSHLSKLRNTSLISYK